MSDKTVSKKRTKTKASKVKTNAKKTKKLEAKKPATKNKAAKKQDISKKKSVKTKPISSNKKQPLAIAKEKEPAPNVINPNKPPVILQILPELKSGGVERGTIEIAKFGQNLGYEMIVASAGGHLVGQLENIHATHITLPLASKNPFTIIANIRRLIKVIKEHKVDIVHARSRAPAWSAYYAAKKVGCHFVTTVHGSYSLGGPLKKIYNSVMTKGEVVIAISEFIKKQIIDLYGVDSNRIKVVPRGVDLDQFTRGKVHKIRMINMADKFRIELDVPVILLPGRFTRWKGQDFLIDALALLENEKFVCIFAGYDKKHENYYKELEKQVVEKNLFQKIRMIGEVKDMPALYSLSDIVISASLRPEAFGRITIEGQAMEKLVVATDHGGSCETIVNGETGWLVKPGDVKNLAEVLRELLHIGARQRKLVFTKARKSVEQNFSLENMAKKTFAVYDELLGRK